MQFSLSKSAILALTAIPAVLGHSGFSNFYINGVNQGDAMCVRMNPRPDQWNFPMPNVAGPEMACGMGGTEGVNRVCQADDGAAMTFEFREVANKPGQGVIDGSHMGPCAVYMKKVDSAINDPGTGDGWFKIWEDGYDEAVGKWCTTKLIENGGFLTVDFPKRLVGGYYLVRPELLALHAAPKGDPQYYLGCAQVFLKSNGDKVPESTVSIPGHMSISDKSDTFNLWQNPLDLPYPIPGPSVATFKSGGVTTQTEQTEGLKPAGCILESGSNFCGVEVSDYSDQAGCWASGKECWNQLDLCYKSAPATGNSGCKAWGEKCQNINDNCAAGNYNGPPSKGKVLTPNIPNPTISTPAPLGPGVGTGGTYSPSTPARLGSGSSSDPYSYDDGYDGSESAPVPPPESAPDSISKYESGSLPGGTTSPQTSSEASAPVVSNGLETGEPVKSEIISSQVGSEQTDDVSTSVTSGSPVPESGKQEESGRGDHACYKKSNGRWRCSGRKHKGNKMQKCVRRI